MGRLLLRSVKDESFASRVDVLFQNVQAIKLPVTLSELEIQETHGAAADRFVAESGLVSSVNAKVFEITSGNGAGYVIAGVCAVLEDDGEFHEPSGLWPGR